MSEESGSPQGTPCIARVQILLPYKILVPADVPFPAIAAEEAGLTFTLRQPYESEIDVRDLEIGTEADLSRACFQLNPRTPPRVREHVTIDGAGSIVANTLVIDVAGREFNRARGTQDPDPKLVFDVVNGLLMRLRALARASVVVRIAPDQTVWRVGFIAQDGTDLEESETLHRGFGATSFQWHALGLSPALWTAAADGLPPGFEPPAWQSLLLDAEQLLAEIGPALVLAYTAIEVRISTALDYLAKAGGFDPNLWVWLKNRGGDVRKEPSVAEQLSHLIQALGGRSLKDDTRLWQAYQNLRKARNSFVHEGRAILGGKPVEHPEALQLIRLAAEIVDWIEGTLPETERQPALKQYADIQMRALLHAPPDTDTEAALRALRED